jgi:hypothetical protein
MAGSNKEEVDQIPQSPRTKGIIQHFERLVKTHNEGIDNDLLVMNDKIGQLEAAQIMNNNRLAGMEASMARTNKSLGALLKRFDDLHYKKVGDGKKEDKKDDKDDRFDGDWDAYGGDTEVDDRDRRRLHRNRRGMGGNRQRDLHGNDDVFSKIKFKIPPFDGKYDLDAYITWKIVVDQKFACHEFPETTRVRAATSEFTDFASIWWIEYGKKNPTNIPHTWDALKRVMRARFVPSYYARDLLHKLQQLRQGTKSLEEYFQELQMGMLRCNTEESEESAIARFVGALNREIQDILACKDYNTVTKCFHLACKAERKVQGQRGAKSNIFAGRSTSWQQCSSTSMTTPNRSAPSDKPHGVTTNSATKSAQKPATSASSVASTARTRGVQCYRCKGYGHVQHDCPSKRVLVVKEDGGYSSASDFDDDTLALLAANDAGKEEPPDEQIGPDDVDRYESLIV